MNKPGRQRLQGTDGIRRETKLASNSECKGLTPQQVFLEKGWITEQFMELYAYSHIKNLPGPKIPKNVVVKRLGRGRYVRRKLVRGSPGRSSRGCIVTVGR